jgi:hypothetical protein
MRALAMMPATRMCVHVCILLAPAHHARPMMEAVAINSSSKASDTLPETL